MVKYIIFLLFIFPIVSLAAFERDLYYGIYNDSDVSKLQEFLTDQNIYNGPITGNFLNLTQDGVKNFQIKEGIEPAAGFLGPITRARANQLLVGEPPKDRDVLISYLMAKIADLQKQLEELQIKQAQEQPEAVSEEEKVVEPGDIIPPTFTIIPKISSSGFVSNLPLPFGPKYVYKVNFDWEVIDETSSVLEESIICSPSIKNNGKSAKNSDYFPDSNSTYSCTVIIKDEAGNEVQSKIDFKTPGWIGVEGFEKTGFPIYQKSLFKLSDITISHASTTNVLFTQIVLKVTDNMDSPLNRDNEVKLILKDGVTTFDKEISSQKFTFHSLHPKNGPHIYFVKLSYPVLYKPGDEKTFSLWMQDFELVLKGLLIFELDEFLDQEIEGGIKIELTG